MSTTTDTNRINSTALAALDVALGDFQRAAQALDRAWEGPLKGDEISSYPTYLPSFDEFVNDIMDMSVICPSIPIVETGTRVVCTSLDERGGHFYVQPGEFGTVVEDMDHILRIKLDLHHDGAAEWDNEAVITPEDGAVLASADASPRTQIQRYFEEHYAVIHPIPTRSN
jgi:hypothetical protein